MQWRYEVPAQRPSCSYVPQGFPGQAISPIETGFVADFADPTNDFAFSSSCGKSSMSRGSSKVFTCAHGGFRLPHSWQVVRPTLVSCRYGTPITISCRATRAISRQARSTSGMCSRTSAQNTQSNDESGNCNWVTSPATVVTCGYSNRGFSKSSPVTKSKYSVNNLEK